MKKPPQNKQEWDAHLKANRVQIEQAAKQIARMHSEGDTEGIVEHANQDAEEHAKQALKQRDKAIKSDKLEEE